MKGISKHMLIRADADEKIGTGHVMRCLALAQAWQDAGGTASIAAQKLPDGIREMLKSERIEIIPFSATTEIEDAEKLGALAKNVADCVVVDGYSFGITHQRALREAGVRQLFIDDYGHASEYIADFVLNQNISADERLYRNRAPHTQLLLGTKYALLRREFRDLENWSRTTAPTVARVMVTMGGADPGNMTLKVVESLSASLDGKCQIRVVVGPANRHMMTLERFQRENAWLELCVRPNIPELMQWADMAVTAAGSTCLEMFYLMLPFVAIVIADNQFENAMRLKEFVPVVLETENVDLRSALVRAVNLEDRVKFAKKARHVVDGLGPARILETLRTG